MSVKHQFDSTSPAASAASSPARVLGFRPPPRTLADLRANQCRYCIADAPKRRMDEALFCAAPRVEGPYCGPHARLCRQPSEFDLDALAAEVAAACEPS